MSVSYLRRVTYKGGTVVDTPVELDQVDRAVKSTTPAGVRSFYPWTVATVQIVRVTEEVIAEADR